ncbi:MAG: response regulator [Bryobacteraceae bacterium]|nr:response regulator [Bryobacteraceae bacterium]
MSETKAPRILLVDDEEMVLTSIRAYLSLETEYEILAHTQPEDALRRLDEGPIDVVVTDYLMPRVTGLQLLAEAKKKQPEAARVLLTGHADKQSAIQAINDVGLYQYLEKPWDNAQLLLVINGAIERTRLLRGLAEKVEELDAAHGQLKEAQRRLIRAFL